VWSSLWYIAFFSVSAITRQM